MIVEPYRNVAICGYPRSGSTLLYNLIAASCVSHRTFDREISAAGLREPAPWISKDPADRRHAELPARRIVMIRDPRDVLCSIHSSHPDRYKVSWDFTVSGKEGQQLIHTEGLLEIDGQCRGLYSALIVRYEHLCSDPDGCQESIARHFGIEFDRRFSAVELDPPPGLTKQLNGVRPISEKRVGAWRKHPERIREQFERAPALHSILWRRGYEEDRRWLAAIQS